ncbi:MAG: formate dehydrogenase subunit alpha [Desulfofustis sp.]
MKKHNLIIDGREVEVTPGTTVLEAARKAGIYIPTLCHDPHLEPYGACRLCIVKIDGIRGLPTSCTTPCEPAMVVITEDEEIARIRRGIIELTLADHPAECCTCLKSEDCELLHVAAYLGVDKHSLERLQRRTEVLPVDTSNPAFDFDPNKCILCGKCVRVCREITGIGAIDLAQRGYQSRVSTFGGKAWSDTVCQSCGECVERCPTGALMPKRVIIPQREVKTLCPFCGVGCPIVVGVRGKEIVRVKADPDSNVSQGGLCVKGRFGCDFVNHPDRLTRPLVRREGVPRSAGLSELTAVEDIFRPAEWDEALELTAAGLAQILESAGGEALGVLSSAKCTNEENYLTQKFARAVLGTNNIDHCARLCHSSTVAAALESFGDGAMSNSIADLDEAEVIFLIGSNPTECHPIIARRIKHNIRKNSARLIVADPRTTELARLADLHMSHHPGSDVALLNGIMHSILASGLHDAAFIARRCEGFDLFRKNVACFTPEQASLISGVPSDDIRRAAEMFAAATRGVVVFGMGITQHTTGVDNVKTIANLLMLTGNMGRKGTGFSPLRGQNNVQGACDMGALPNVYPGYQKIDEPAARGKFSEAWQADLNCRKGLPLTDMIVAANHDLLQGMYVIGENPLMSEPNLEHTRQAMTGLSFLAVQDIFMTETAKLADVVLPAACFAEKSGTFTNTERRVQLVRQVLEPPGSARADWQIVAELSSRLGYAMSYADSGTIMKEIAALTPIYGGISHRRLERQDGLQWPCWDKRHRGTPRLHVTKFTRGRGKFHAVTYKPPAEKTSMDFPLVLTTGRLLEHFHTGTMSRRSRVLDALEPHGHIDMNEKDAALVGVHADELLQVSSPRGEIVVQVRIDKKVPPGTAFMAFHWREAPANLLTSEAVDPTARIPEYKVSSIRIEKAKVDGRT